MAKKKFVVMSKDVENRLVMAAKEGDKAAQEKLCKQFTGAVKKIAQQYAGKNEDIDFDDLVQEGYIGFMRAWMKFDSSKSCFYTYMTYWVKAFVQHAVQTRMVDRQVLSYDVPIHVDGEETYLDRIAANDPLPDETVGQQQEIAIVRHVLRSIGKDYGKRYATVVEMRMLREKESLQAVSDKLHISRESARKDEFVIRRLAKPLLRRALG